MNLDYSNANICRICEKGQQFINIFSDEYQYVIKKLRACADIMIGKEDLLPNVICKQCEVNLEFAYNFKIQCEFTDRKFRRLFSRAKNTEYSNVNSISYDHDYNEEYIDFDVKYDYQNDSENNTETYNYDIEYNEPEFETAFIKIEENFTDEIINGYQTLKELQNDIRISDSISKNQISLEFTNLNKLDAEENSCELIEIDHQGLADEDEFESIKSILKHKSENTNKEKFKIKMSDSISTNQIIVGFTNKLVAEENSCELFEIDHQSLSDEDESGSIKSKIKHKSENTKKDNFEIEISDSASTNKIIVGFTNKLDAEENSCELIEIDHQSFSDVEAFETTKSKAKDKTENTNKAKCQYCGKWITKPYIRKHINYSHTNAIRYQCKKCDKSYAHPENLNRHVKVFHKKLKPHKCNVCNQLFSQNWLLKQHQNVHSDDRPFKCNTCDKCFKSKTYLDHHQIRHTSNYRASKFYLSNRTRNYNSNSTRNYLCTVCGKKFPNSKVHNDHMRTHTGEKPFECNICKKSFAISQSLKLHYLVHSGEKPYKCKECGVSFRQINHLRYHYLTHTGEKNHKCLVCGKAFAMPQTLKVHTRIHTGETPYHCTICDRKFIDLNGLKRHKLKHIKT